MPDRDLSIRLDPLNPGHFFACCGLFELLTLEEPGLLARFYVDPRLPRTAMFRIQTQRGNQVLNSALAVLKISSVAFEESDKEAVRPAVLSIGAGVLKLDWWLDEFRQDTTNLKCWAGQVTTRGLFTELLPLVDPQATGNDLFQRSASTTSLFGVDPRSAWNTLDLGFSPNEHGVASTVFPAVEVLAAIGLQYFRPDSARRSGVPYALWQEPLPAGIARLAFRAPWQGSRHVALQFEIAKRGQSYKYFSFGRNADVGANT